MGVLKKIQILKRGLIALVCINIVVLSTSLFATYNYFSLKIKLEDEWTQKQDRISQIQGVETNLLKLSLRQPKNAEEQYEYRRDSDRLREELLDISSTSHQRVSFVVDPKATKITPDESQEIASLLGDLKQKDQLALRELLTNSMKASSQAAIAGALTVLFGIFLPMLISFFMTRALLEAKRSYEEMVAQWIAKYMYEWQQSGDKPFQNPLFWANMMIVTVEIFGRQSRHPAMQIISELAPLIKKEMNKSA
jgi:hypothetical protein